MMRAPAVDAATFRHLLGTFASGVTVITTRDASGAPAGMTASAFCSVSLDPPLILVCVGRDGGFLEVLRAAPLFGVNVLADGQAALSERFAGAWSDRFRGVALDATDPDQPPRIGGSAAWLVCETVNVLPGGDHAIFVARVVSGEATDRRPLIHVRGGYRELAR